MEKQYDLNATDPIISIGTVAEKLGISVSNIRKYEAEGLIIPHRTESGHRLFSLEDVDRIRIIQKMIQSRGLNIEGIRRLQALLPCWEFLPCGKDQREKCTAYRDTSRPCWSIKGNECASQAGKCRTCVVYRLGSQCIEDIKRVLHEKRENKSIEETINELIRQRNENSNKEI